MCSVLYLPAQIGFVFNAVFFRGMQSLFIVVLREIKADGRKLHSVFCLILQKKNSEWNNKMQLIGDLVFSLSCSLSKKRVLYVYSLF